MDQYENFTVDDGETEDERVCLTESGEYADVEEVPEITEVREAPPKPVNKKNQVRKKQFTTRKKNQVRITDAPQN